MTRVSGPSARVLLVCHDAGGTVPPMVALADALVRGGHDVTVLSQPSVRARAESAGARFVRFTDLGDYDRFVPLEQQLALTLPALVADLVTPVLRTVDADVLVVDANLAGCLAAAESSGRPTAVLLHSMFATFTDVWMSELWPLLAGGINDTRAALGLAPVGSWADAFAPHARLLSVVPSRFDAPVSPAVGVPASMRHFGFLVPAAPPGSFAAAADAFPEGEGPTVLVASGTTQQGQGPRLEAMIDALGTLRVRSLVTTAGFASPPPSSVPANVRVVDHVPHASVLPATDVMVTHAGLGSVAAALSCGVPLVCTPIDRDQPLNTGRVVALGAGVAAGDDVVGAVLRVLGDASYRTGAEAIADASAAEGGAHAAARDLVSLGG